jgi:hypothetical protein
MLTHNEVRDLLVEFEYDFWVDASRGLDMGIADDIHFATGGHPALVQTMARALQNQRISCSQFPTREAFLATVEGGGILATVAMWPWVKACICWLRAPEFKSHRALLARTFIPLGPGESAQVEPDARKLASALVSFEVLKPLGGDRFSLAGPLMRQILLKMVLPLDNSDNEEGEVLK